MTSTRAQRVLGALAALALFALLAGTPCALLAFGADPGRLLPNHWPDPAPISQWPERIWHNVRWAWITGDLVLTLLVAVAWAGWALLSLSVVVEVLRQTGRQTGQGVRAARGALAHIPRGRWIAGLVAAVLLSTSTGTATASTQSAAQVTVTAPPHPHERASIAPRDQTVASHEPRQNGTEAAAPATAEHDDDGPHHTVVYGDTLWGLAEQHLGAGIRYHEIVARNTDLLAHGSHDLEPGWVLQMPPDARDLPQPQMPTGHSVTVVPGDTLSAIAARELGDPNRWRELADLNSGRTQPDGRALRDPNQLMPGWQLVLPTETAPPGKAQPDRESPSPKIPTSSPPLADPPDSEQRNGNQDTHGQEDTSVLLPGGGLVSFGLALSVAVLLAVARRRRRARYRPTGDLTRTAEPALVQTGPTVRILTRAAAHHTAVEERTGESDATDQGTTRSTADRDNLNSRSAPECRGRVRDAVLRRQRVWPPPAPLVTIHTDRQTHSLDLAATAGLVLTGSGAPAAVRAVLATTLAVDAAHPAHALLADPATAEDIRGQRGQTAWHEVPGVEVTEDEAAALARLHAELARRTRLRAEDQLKSDLHANRTYDVDGQDDVPVDPIPLLLVVARPSPRHRREWATILDQGREFGLHALFLGDLPDAGDFTQLTLDVNGTITAAHGPGTGPVTGARAETLAPPEADEIWNLLAAARAPAPLQPDDTNLDDYSKADAVDRERGASTVISDALYEDRNTTMAKENDPAVVVRLLGGVRVQAHGSHVRGLRARAREVLAYLAAHRHGTTADMLREAVLPDQPAARLHEAISYARSALRKATGENDKAFVVAESGRYYLDPDALTTDVWTLEDTLTRARTTGDSCIRLEALRQFVDVCRSGAPLEGAPYSWAESVAEHWRSQAVDALVALAGEVRDRNPDEALDALAVAIIWDPYTEALYRRTIALQRDLGRLDAAHATYRRLQANLRDIDLEPDLDTTALLDETPVPRS